MMLTHPAKPRGQTTEFRGNFTDVVAVQELRGGYPEIPIAEGIDYSALIAGDADPMFVSLPIGKANVVSGNKRFYDEAWLQELERQVVSNRPVGLMGHLPADQRGWAMPPESLHWVGAARDSDGTLWGKAYVVPGETRQRLARYKAQGKSIATSIDAIAEGTWDENIKAYRMKADTLRLGQIDLAPTDRAGIPALAAVPIVTTEMDSRDEEPEPEQENDMPEKGKLDYINEMTAEDARLLPEPVRQAIVESVPTAPEVAQVAQIRELLGLDDKADVVQTVTEMRRTQDEQRKAAVQARITELAADPEKGVKLEAVRGLVVELVTARNPATIQEAETVYSQVVESNAVKAALKSHVVETMGPRQGAGSLPAQNGKQGRYFTIPADKEG